MRRVLATVLTCGLMLLPSIGAADSDTSAPKTPKTQKARTSKKTKAPAEEKAAPKPKTEKKAASKPKAKAKQTEKKQKKEKQLSLVARIESSNPATVAKAIKTVEEYKTPKAVKTLAQRVRNGLPPALLDAAIEALGSVKSYVAYKELTRLSDHRRAAVRVNVAKQLANFNRPAVLKTLTKMLDDQEAEVRGIAARGLGRINAQKSMKHLIIAAKRQIPEAAHVVGSKAKPHHVKKVLASLDEKSFDALAPVFAKVLEREDMPKKAKLKVIEKVAAVGADGAASLLVKHASSLGKNDPMRKEISEALRRNSEKEKADGAKRDDVPKESKAGENKGGDKPEAGGAK